MKFSIVDAPQRSFEWFAARLGRLTGSAAADMLKEIKSGEAAGRRDLRVRLVLERLTGVPQDADGFVSADMQHGIETESAAVAAYQELTGRLVGGSGFLRCDDLMAGCSLDGQVNDFEGLIEIKCPKPATHLDTLKRGTVPTEYLRQITHNLWISGAQWADFLSFDDRFPEPMRAIVIRVLRSQADVDAYDRKARAFLAEVDAEYGACLGWSRAASLTPPADEEPEPFNPMRDGWIGKDGRP